MICTECRRVVIHVGTIETGKSRTGTDYAVRQGWCPNCRKRVNKRYYRKPNESEEAWRKFVLSEQLRRR